MAWPDAGIERVRGPSSQEARGAVQNGVVAPCYPAGRCAIRVRRACTAMMVAMSPSVAQRE
jgi:hypothetical protein